MKPDERYTWRACADGYTDTGLRKGITEGDAICQLADYEDTGLSPEEVRELLSFDYTDFIKVLLTNSACLGVDLSLDGESITAVKIALAMKAGANAIKADEIMMMGDYVIITNGKSKEISYERAAEILVRIGDKVLEEWKEREENE